MDAAAGRTLGRALAGRGAAGAGLAAEGAAAARLGEFELLSELGRGGMGDRLPRLAAVAGPAGGAEEPATAGDTKAEARFNREIHALGRVEHPNLVKVFTSGIEADQWFYAMELVEGRPGRPSAGSCRARARAPRTSTWRPGTPAEHRLPGGARAEKPLSTPTTTSPNRPAPVPATPAATAGGRDYVRHVVELVRQAAEAAHALHEAGVIHRDIKPDNILVTPDGRQAVLMDLGLAQLADESEGRLTRTRQFVGHAPLRQPRAGALGAARSPQRRLQPGRDALGIVDPAAAVRRHRPDADAGPDAQDPVDRPRAAAAAEPAGAGGPGSDRAEVPGEGPSPPLCDGRGAWPPTCARWLRGEPVQAQPPTFGYLLGKSLRRNRVAVALVSLSIVALMAVIVAGSFGVYSGRLQRAYASESAARELSVIAQGESRFIRRKLRRG